MNTWILLSVICGMIPQIIVIWQVTFKKTPLSLVTYIMWAILVTISSVSLYWSGGNWQLQGGFATTDIIIMLLLIRNKEQLEMDTWKYICCGMVVICLIIRFTTTHEVSYVASVSATAISSFPQMQKTWQNPKTIQYSVWGWLLFAAIFQFVPTTDWTIMQRFYPIVLGSMIIILFIIKAYREYVDRFSK